MDEWFKRRRITMFEDIMEAKLTMKEELRVQKDGGKEYKTDTIEGLSGGR